MAILEKLKTKLNDQSDAASAISKLTEFTAMVVTGTAISGGALTLPLILAKSGETASALLKLTKLLLPSGEEEAQNFDAAERVDEIFYVFAQRAYLEALSKFKKKLPANVEF